MPINTTYLPYSDTGYFSQLATDYLSGHPELSGFYTFSPDAKGIAAAIEQRKQYPVDRQTLVTVLQKQYAGLQPHDRVLENIALLQKENTFTVCTAHQPNLLTGYLYFIYKIVHAIKLAEELNTAYPDKKFVPVYYMGSEDNDLEELGTFRYGGKKFVWEAQGQTGAVGRMLTKSIKPVLDELFKLLGPPGKNTDELKELLTKAYLGHANISEATQYLVNELFGRFGLIVLNPDEAAFKQAIIPVLKDDLLHQTAYSIVSAEIEKLEVHYNAQAHPRPINLFYLKDNLRERIEKRGDTWHTLNSDTKWQESELMAELEAHPERFSPNVILRGIFQESILPDVAFIGGGAEVAYWLELKAIFEHYHVFYPVILLRQSVLWINDAQAKLRKQLGLSIPEIFKPELVLIRNFISNNTGDEWQTTEESATIEKIMAALKLKATALDVTLKGSAEAVLTKIKYQLQVLEKKMLRAEKRKLQTELARITRLKHSIFPGNGLQERIENFADWYIAYGPGYLDILNNAMQPLQNEFLVIEDAS